ncbi:hypothetical protein [Streptomyces sp. AC495_CC817]|uniref:hypothetical protein n=1 Tax=Streptomyces sp. AC495_CC817 TaxID=2823900 RepID=UPI001C27A8C6|nr:hypothetical protein [Streptomyces sp. AC495_CC817]
MSEPQQPPLPPHGQPAPYPPTPPQAPGYTQPYPPAQPQRAPQTPPAPQPPVAGYSAQPYPAPRPAGSGAALARIAFVLAVAGVLIEVLLGFAYPIFFRVFGYFSPASTGVVFSAVGFLVFAVSLAALILALIAVRRGASKVVAGIAIGISASAIAGTLVSWLSNLFYVFL